MNESAAKHITEQLLSAIEYLHFFHDIVHRNIKLENVLCCENNHIYLLGFNDSKRFDSCDLKTKTGTP